VDRDQSHVSKPLAEQALEAQDAGDVAPAHRAHLQDLAVGELDAVILAEDAALAQLLVLGCRESSARQLDCHRLTQAQSRTTPEPRPDPARGPGPCAYGWRMAIGWFAVAMLLMLVGLLGAVVPLLPGLPLVLAGVYVYALATGLGAGIGPGHLVLYTLIGGAAILFGSLANLFGARAAGGSRAGALGAMLGLLVGLVLGGPLGLLIGPFLGAVALELLAGQAAGRALRSGLGAAVGLLVGRLAELTVSVGMIASFVFSVVTAAVQGKPG